MILVMEVVWIVSIGRLWACMYSSLSSTQPSINSKPGKQPSGVQLVASFIASMVRKLGGVLRLKLVCKYVRLFNIALGAHSLIPCSTFGKLTRLVTLVATRPAVNFPNVEQGINECA